MSTVWIRVAFGPVIALLLAFTAIFGVLMAAPGPERPRDPGITFRQLSADDSTQTQRVQQIDDFYGSAARFRGEYPDWQRNVFLAGAGLGLLFALIGLALPAVVNYLRWGLLLGALLVFAWAYTTATADVPRVTPTGSNLLSLLGAGEPAGLNFAGRFARFAVSFIALILTLFLGVWRLTEWAPAVRRVPPAPVGPAPATSWAPATVATPPSGPPPPLTGTEPTTEWRRPDA